MNKKAILVVTMILGLVVLVPLVAASPLLQNQNNDTLKVQDQTQLQDCHSSCIQADDCQQNQTCTRDRQCLQDCDGIGICDELCNATQTQTRERFGQQECGQTNVNGGQQNCHAYQYQFQQKDYQAP